MTQITLQQLQKQRTMSTLSQLATSHAKPRSLVTFRRLFEGSCAHFCWIHVVLLVAIWECNADLRTYLRILIGQHSHRNVAAICGRVPRACHISDQFHGVLIENVIEIRIVPLNRPRVSCRIDAKPSQLVSCQIVLFDVLQRLFANEVILSLKVNLPAETALVRRHLPMDILVVAHWSSLNTAMMARRDDLQVVLLTNIQNMIPHF